MNRYCLLIMVQATLGCGQPNASETQSTLVDGLIVESVTAGGSGGLDAQSRDASIAAFSLSVFPLVRTNCASCHASDVAPFLATSDPGLSHETVVGQKKVDFQSVARSRLVDRLRTDRHNCWGNCEENATAMERAIGEWASRRGALTGLPLQKGIPTTSLGWSARESGLVENPNGDGTMLFEAESADLSGNMDLGTVASAGAGLFVFVPAGSGSEFNAAIAAAEPRGHLEIQVFAPRAGLYQIAARVNGEDDGSNSIWVGVNDEPLRLMEFTFNGSLTGTTPWIWARAAANSQNPAEVFSLRQGVNRVRMVTREDGIRIDRIAVTPNPFFDPNNMVLSPSGRPSFKFDVSAMIGRSGESGNSGVWLVVEVDEFDAQSYRFSSPRLVLSEGAVWIKGLRPLVNGVSLPQHATWSGVDTVVRPPGAVLSAATMIVLKDKGPSLDQLGFLFESLQSL